MSHYQVVCEKHGTVYSQCRCASPNKAKRLVECRPITCDQKARKTTFNEWLVQAVKTYAVAQPNYERWGQFLFNELERIRVDLANEVRGVPDLDPFHIDDNVGEFLDFVALHWDQ